MPWASQGRGVFAIPMQVRIDETPLAESWADDLNEVRRTRAAALAERHGVSPTVIALAWVLGTAVPTRPIIGPRSQSELLDSFMATRIALSDDEVRWLTAEP
jgi:aryl-alcohol dehydrogenase-like predicted oxidoreductase